MVYPSATLTAGLPERIVYSLLNMPLTIAPALIIV